jgi:hypothetical protein
MEGSFFVDSAWQGFKLKEYLSTLRTIYFMKKVTIALLFLSAGSAQSFFFTKPDAVSTDIAVKFISKKTDQVVTDPSYVENAKSCIEILQDFAQQQENRELTVEEIMIALKIIIFLFLQETNDYSKSIVIQLKNGKKIELPYSQELFEQMFKEQDFESEE